MTLLGPWKFLPWWAVDLCAWLAIGESRLYEFHDAVGRRTYIQIDKLYVFILGVGEVRHYRETQEDEGLLCCIDGG